MPKKNAKELVGLIKKLAAPPKPPAGWSAGNVGTPAPAPSPAPPNLPPPPPPPIGTDTAAPAPAPDSAVPPPPGEAPAVQRAAPPASIVNMQKELQGLAQDMTKQVNMEQLGGPRDPKTKKQQGLMEGQVSPEQKQAYGRMSFADFITQHYTRDSDIPGVEFDWDPSKTEMDQKDPSKPTRTNVVMDTMTRIGNPTLPGKKPEFAIDGDWGPRTNASLRNAYAMAFGLLEMAKDFNYQPRSYNSNNLTALKGLIPRSSHDINEAQKIKNAKEITEHLKHIRTMYHEVEEHILNNTGFTPYIEGTQAYTTYGPGSTPDPRVLEELNKKFANMKVTGNVGGRNVTLPITVNDLVSPQALEAWQKQNMPNMQLMDILAQVKQHLNDTDPSRGAPSLR